jgi:hypothetical protein
MLGVGLSSQGVSTQVLSLLVVFTAVFGMGTGVFRLHIYQTSISLESYLKFVNSNLQISWKILKIKNEFFVIASCEAELHEVNLFVKIFVQIKFCRRIQSLRSFLYLEVSFENRLFPGRAEKLLVVNLS